MRSSFVPTFIASLLFAGAASAQAPESEQSTARHDDHARRARAVYTQTNAAEGNEILAFSRDSRGALQLTHRVATRGLGTGAGLGSQGALALTRDGRYLYAVNAGSDTISVFVRVRSSLVLFDRVSSGGDQPISLTLHGDVLYVLNAGTGNNITGFHVRDDGRLRPLAGSTQALSGDAVQPAQVQFNNTGDFLAVTEYFDDADSPLEVISGSVKSGQTSACWVAVTKNGRYSYVANTGSGTISTYRIARTGELAVLANGGSANTGGGSKPQDLALSRGNQFLFVLTPGVGTVQSFKVHEDGSLRAVASAPGVPASAQGLVAM